jgi:ABC-type amino acid transport substrate-binding protein
MTATVPIATFLSRPAADEAADLLRANRIKCAVVDPQVMSSVLGLSMGDRPQYTLIVAPEDEARARESLGGSIL